MVCLRVLTYAIGIVHVVVCAHAQPTSSAPLTPQSTTQARQALQRAWDLAARQDINGAAAAYEESVRLDSTDSKTHQAMAVELFARESRLDYRYAWRHAFAARQCSPLDNPLLLKHIANSSSKSACLPGLRWLARHQMPDGRWCASAFPEACRNDGTPRCTGAGKSISDVEATSLALCAFLWAGYSHLSSDVYDCVCFGDTCKRSLQWLQAQQNAGGAIGSPPDEPSLRHHALATLAFSEAYRYTKSKLLIENVTSAVTYLTKHRLPGSGWRERSNAAALDAETTGWSLFALHSAKRAGLAVPDEVLAEAWKSLDDTRRSAGVSDSTLTTLFADAVELLAETTARRALSSTPAKIQPKTPPPPAPSQSLILHRLLSGAVRVQQEPVDSASWKTWCTETKKMLAKGMLPPDHDVKCPSGSWDFIDGRKDTAGRLTRTLFHTLTQEIMYRYENILFLRGR